MELASQFIPIVEQCDFELVEIQEARESKLPPQFLGAMRGVTFVSGGDSRNGRHYPQDFWPYILREGTELQRVIHDNNLFGTIGHVEKPKDDLLRDGNASHITTKLWIDEAGRGMGLHYILDTPTGRILNTIIRAGAKMRTSTKGRGLFLTEKSPKGHDIPDKKNFILERVDFVCDPGFLEARPVLMEKFNEALSSKSDKRGSKMDKDDATSVAISEKLIADNRELSVKLNEALKNNEEKDKKIKFLKSRTEELEENSSRISEEVDAELEQYDKIGSPDQIMTALREALTVVKNYKKLGSPAEISEKLSVMQGFISRVGSPRQIEETLQDVVETFKVLGPPSKIREALLLFRNLIRKCGKPAEIEENLKKATNVIESLVTEQKITEGLAIARKYNVAPSIVGKLVRHLPNMAEVEEAVEEISSNSSSITGRYHSTPGARRVVAGRRGRRISEDLSNDPRAIRTLRMFESFNGRNTKLGR